MSREKILARIKASQPSTVGELVLDDIAIQYEDTKATFMESIELAGGTSLEVSCEAEVLSHVQAHFSEKSIYNGLNETENLSKDPHDYEDLDFALFKSDLAVAENGAVYLSFASAWQHSAPFLTQMLGLVVKRSDIVNNMAEAYRKIEASGLESYGVFISGPSKTADIEQCLVKGAHGACELIVYLVDV